MGAKRWGNALPNGQTEIEALKALLIEKGLLTEAEVAQSRRPEEQKGKASSSPR